MKEADQEDKQWKMSAVPCPFCPNVMQLVGKELAGTHGHLLTFQCDCGLIFSTRDDH